MASLADLAREHTSLNREEILHLNRLVTEWGMLADFSFSDLLLYLPTVDNRWLIVGQIRPATGQTIYQTDWVGAWANDTERPVLSAAVTSGEISEGVIKVEDLPDEAQMVAIPVAMEGKVIAVLTKEWVVQTGRRPGELEHVYSTIFERFAKMIAAGRVSVSIEGGRFKRRTSSG
jgi:two-component system, sensor histidine kinase PdtaS